MRGRAGCFDSAFSTLLRYLLVTARSFHGMRDRGGHRCGGACGLAGDLLLPERAARPLHPETGGAFPEATVQALGQVRVSLVRVCLFHGQIPVFPCRVRCSA